MVALFWQTGKGGEWQVIWCLRRPQINHDVGSLCNSTMWLFNFLLVKRTLKQKLQVKETSVKKDRGELDQYALLHHQTVLHYTLPPLPFHFLLIIITLILPLLLILLLLLLFKEVWKASWHSLLSCRDLLDRPWPPPPPGSKIMTGFKIFTSYKIVRGILRLWFSDLCKPDRTWKRNKNWKRTKEPKTKQKRTKKNL